VCLEARGNLHPKPCIIDDVFARPHSSNASTTNQGIELDNDPHPGKRSGARKWLRDIM
jgi:hypothetical protein